MTPKFDHVVFEDDERVITMDGRPVGQTVNRSNAQMIARWLTIAWNDMMHKDKEPKAMTPTPPRGLIALSLGDGGSPLFVRASDIVTVDASDDGVNIALTNDSCYTVDDDLATVLAAIDATTPAA